MLCPNNRSCTNGTLDNGRYSNSVKDFYSNFLTQTYTVWPVWMKGGKEGEWRGVE